MKHISKIIFIITAISVGLGLLITVVAVAAGSCNSIRITEQLQSSVAVLKQTPTVRRSMQSFSILRDSLLQVWS